MANGLFGNTFRASPEEEASAELYSMMGTDVPALGQTSQGETGAFQPIAFGEGGTTMIDTSAPATQEDLMQAGFTQMGLPILGGASILGASVGTQPSLVGSPRTTTTIPRLVGTGTPTFTGTVPPRPMPGTQLAPPTQPPAVTSGTATTVGRGTATTLSRGAAARGAAGLLGRQIATQVVPTAALVYGAEEAPKLFGSEKSTSEILTELAATTPEERAGAAEYAALGTDVAPLGPVIDAGVVSKPPAQTLSQFMRYEDRPEQRTEQFVDPQGRIRRRMISTRELAPEYKTYEDEAKARRDRIEAGPDFMTTVPTSMTGQTGGSVTPTAANVPSEIQGILLKPAQMRTQDEIDRLARFNRSTLGQSLGGISAIEESMMGPIQSQRAELGLQADRLRFEQEKLQLENAGFVATDVETDPETGVTVQIFKKGDETRRVFKGVARAPEPDLSDPGAGFIPTDGNAAVPLGPVKGDIVTQGGRRYKFDGKNYELID